MKKALLILYAAAALTLSGCRGELFSGHRDMEHLRPVQTVGLDAEEDGAVTLSISSGAGPEDGPPLVMRATAPGIETAADRLQDWSPQDELFYAHTRYLLVGEAMAGTGLEAVLDWVERSPAMRMETPMLLVRGRADVFVTGAGSEETDATERLASLERERVSRGQALPTLRQTTASLLERGWALCLAVEALPDEGTVFSPGESGQAVVPAGLALLRPGRPAAWLTRGEALGAAILDGSAAGAHVPAGDAMFEILESSVEVGGVWVGDGLAGAEIRCELLAGMSERGSLPADDPGAAAAALEEAARESVAQAVARAQALGCDCLALGDRVLASAPDRRAAQGTDWEARFPALPVTVSVRAELGRGYDLRIGGDAP